MTGGPPSQTWAGSTEKTKGAPKHAIGHCRDRRRLWCRETQQANTHAFGIIMPKPKETCAQKENAKKKPKMAEKTTFFDQPVNPSEALVMGFGRGLNMNSV